MDLFSIIARFLKKNETTLADPLQKKNWGKKLPNNKHSYYSMRVRISLLCSGQQYNSSFLIWRKLLAYHTQHKHFRSCLSKMYITLYKKNDLIFANINFTTVPMCSSAIIVWTLAAIGYSQSKCVQYPWRDVSSSIWSAFTRRFNIVGRDGLWSKYNVARWGWSTVTLLLQGAITCLHTSI